MSQSSVRAAAIVPDHDLRAIAQSFGTPTYVYSAPAIGRRWTQLRAIVPAGIRICYSLKANPNTHLVRTFGELGADFEVASGGELEILGPKLARRALFVGPAKRQAELASAGALGLGMLIAESARELERLASTPFDTPIRVALRLNAGRGDGDVSMGGDTQFGFDFDTAVRQVRRFARATTVDLRGVHAFLASGVAHPNAFLRNVRLFLEACTQIEKETGWSPRYLGIGGGFGIQRYASDPEVDWSLLTRPLDDLLRTYRATNEELEDVSVECGRFLIGPVGVLLLTVVDVKVTRGKTYVLLDGGTNVWGGDDRYFGARPPILSVVGGGDQREQVTLCGPLCTPFDRIASLVDLPRLEPDDLVAVWNAGAYGLTASRLFFLSQQTPAEVLWNDGSAALIRSRVDIGQAATAWPEVLQWSDMRVAT